MSKPASLVSVHAKAAELTPERRRFNQLIRQIEKARRTLADWQEQIPLFNQACTQVLDPLRTSLSEVMRQWVAAIDTLLARRDWSRGERRTLRQLLCEIAGVLLEAGEDESLKALYDKHSSVTFDAGKHQELQDLKEMTEIFTGIDLGDAQDIRSEEDLVERMHEQMEAREQAKRTRQAARPRRKSVTQARREAEAQLAAQSVRDVYRKLVSALHPDREPDTALRAQKNALMQQVNRAYEANDLLTLLEVQLQVEGVRVDGAGDVSQQRLQHYNKVLAEQLSSLRRDLETISMDFCIDFGLDPQALDPRKLGRVIEEQARALRAQLQRQQRDLQMLSDSATARLWLKRQQRAQRRHPDIPF